MPRPTGNGPGWGGPAKGAGTGGHARAFTADDPNRVSAAALNDDPDTQAYRQERRAEKRDRRRLKEERTVEIEDRLFDVFMGAKETTAVAVQAGRALHAIWNGQPVSNVNMKANVRRSIDELSDEELVAFAGSGSGESGTDEEGGGEE